MWMWWLGCDDRPSVAEAGECTPGRVDVVAGVPGFAGRGADGLPADETWLFQPQDVAVGPDGVWWIVDYNNHLIREVGADGITRVVVGSGFPSGGDGGPALEEPLDHPTMALSVEPGALWFAATGNHRIGLADLDAATVSFPYGTGFTGFQGDGGPAADAWFWRPSSLAFSGDGTMYVSDRMNQVVRAIAPDGTISTAVGTPGVPGYDGDGGPAAAATLNAPEPTETDPGNRLDVAGQWMLIADTGNSAIRQVDLTTGIIDTWLGPADGLLRPHDVAIGSWVAVADTDQHRVRVYFATGEWMADAGEAGVEGPADPRVSAEDAHFGAPIGVAWAPDGSLLIADRNNHVIRRWCKPYEAWQAASLLD
jgi:DNA-binding beta-propeller fold protein YncE